MATDDWRQTALSPEATLSAALQSLERTAQQIVLVLDSQGRLQGTLTDGDVRRALINGETLDSPISTHMKTNPVTIEEGTSAQNALNVLTRMAIRAAPVVDTGGRVTSLMTLNDLMVPLQRDSPAVIMAGGRGARLRPLTDGTPKPLISINGEALIDITTRRLVSHGFRQIWVTTHYRAEEIQDHLGDGDHLGAQIQYITEPIPLGTAGGIRQVPVLSEETPILVCNSDNLHSINFSALIDYHIASRAWATLAVAQHVTEIPYGVVSIGDGFVNGLVEKPRQTDWVATGVSIVTQRALSLFPQGQRLDIPTVIEELLDQGLPAGAFECSGYWSDVGNPESLQRVRSEHKT